MKIDLLPQTHSSKDTSNSAARVADIPTNSVNKKTTNTGNSAHTASNGSTAMGNTGVDAITPNGVVLDGVNSQSRSSPTRSTVARAATNTNQSTSSPEVSVVNISIPGVGESLPTQAASPEVSLDSTASQVDTRSDANDPAGSPDPRTDSANISDSLNEPAMGSDLSQADTQPAQWKIYEQRRLAQCQQFTEFLMRSGKSLYELDRRTRLVMTDTYKCF